MGIKVEDVQAALSELEKGLPAEDVNKASEQDLDQPEGDDLGKNKGKKMSDAAPGPDKSPTKKSEDMSKGDDMDYDDDDEKKEGKKMKEKAEKSFTEDLPEEIQTKVDVSEFLRSLVDHTGEAIDDLAGELQKSEARNVENTSNLVGAVEEIQKSQAKIGIVLKAICERIGVIESSPAAAPKSETVAKSEAAVTERTFSSALEENKGEEPMFKSLDANPIIAKSQISNAICELVKKGEATDMDVIGFESNHYLSPEVATKLQTILN